VASWIIFILSHNAVVVVFVKYIYLPQIKANLLHSSGFQKPIACFDRLPSIVIINASLFCQDFFICIGCLSPYFLFFLFLLDIAIYARPCQCLFCAYMCVMLFL
jgi:hypothetical protein